MLAAVTPYTTMYETILIAIDDSDGAERAVEHALEVADRENASIHALHVVDTRSYGEPALSTAELVVDQAEDEGHQLLHAFADRATTRGVPVTTRCVHGVPHEEILAYASEVDADLIVLGYEAKNRHRYIGSTTRAIVDTSDRTVHTP
jgi:nucleotide-binding universal stress UspA family protein